MIAEEDLMRIRDRFRAVLDDVLGEGNYAFSGVLLTDPGPSGVHVSVMSAVPPDDVPIDELMVVSILEAGIRRVRMSE